MMASRTASAAAERMGMRLLVLTWDREDAAIRSVVHIRVLGGNLPLASREAVSAAASASERLRLRLQRGGTAQHGRGEGIVQGAAAVQGAGVVPASVASSSSSAAPSVPRLQAVHRHVGDAIPPHA